jgi:hypothetical protein
MRVRASRGTSAWDDSFEAVASAYMMRYKWGRTSSSFKIIGVHLLYYEKGFK